MTEHGPRRTWRTVRTPGHHPVGRGRDSSGRTGIDQACAQPDPHVIYDNVLGRHAIAKEGNVIKMFLNLSPPTTTTLPANGDILIDNVDSLTLSYYKDYLAGQSWVLGTDDMDLLTAIRFNLTLIGVGGNFSTVVYPRNK